MQSTLSQDICTLCKNGIGQNPFKDQDFVFCCPGCLAVFRILSAKNALDSYQDNPLFKLAVQSGLISNPELLEQIRVNQKEAFHEVEKWHLQISEMWCPSCAEVIKLILEQEKGIKQCIVDYATDLACIEFSLRHISKEKIEKIIKALGYQPQTLSDPKRKAVSLTLYLRFIVAAFCSLNIMMFAYPLYATYFDFEDQGYGQLFAWLSFWLSLPILFYSAFPILKRFFISLKVAVFGMETLVVMGVVCAMTYSCYELFWGENRVYFDSMSVIIVFVLLGKIMEAKAKFSSKEALLKLSQGLPKKGRKKFPDGKEEFVLLKEIVRGDCMVSVTGEKIVLDGEVVQGEGLLDESLMTGESFPQKKEKGDFVLAGTILQQGRIVYKVTKDPEATVLKTMIEMVNHDFGKKFAYTRPVDRLIPWFIPIVLLIAIITGTGVYLLDKPEMGKTVLETAILRSIAVLLISCPCAIGIAAPLAESHLINGLASLGIIVRNRGCLKWLGKETVFIFDKTGTVTEGKFKVMKGLETFSKNLLPILKGLSGSSTHPIAYAINNSVDAEAVHFDKIEEFAGKGLRGKWKERTYFLGSFSFLNEQGFMQVTETENLGIAQTEVYFGEENGAVFPLTLGDSIRPQIKKIIGSLLPAPSLLLSGDRSKAVAKIASLCGFRKYQAGCSPLEKRERVDQERKKGEIVCMFGDGINDALALTGAHIGISVLSAADISIQVSDILLTTDNLEVIPKMRALARKGQRIVSQNIFWAFFYNSVGIGLASFGFLSPIFAAFAMVLSSLIVLFNASLRLKVKD